MLSPQELKKIREFLENSQNPIFFFDNDVDGLSACLLLRRFINRGKAVAIKSYPGLGKAYIRKLYEIKSDMIFVLDKPYIEPEFLEEVKKLQLPLVWIDHHAPQELEYVNYFNPLNGKPPTSEATSYLCYQVTKKPENLWIALLGNIADWQIPDFFDDAYKMYPEILVKTKNPGDIIYGTEFGKIIKMLNFALKDRTSFVTRMLFYMFKVKSPYEILNLETKEAKFIHSRFERINKKYQKYIERAKKLARGEILIFTYSGEFSLSSDIANELIYNYPEKLVVVAYTKGSKINISLRHNKIDLRKFLDKVMESIEGTHGGHEHACGATLDQKDFEMFKKKVFEVFKSMNK